MSFPARFVNLSQARHRFGPQVDRVGALLTASDDLADRAVDSLAMLDGREAMRVVNIALQDGIGAVPRAPEALRALFAELEHVPAWVDEEALDRGGELLLRGGWLGGIALAVSLVFGYASPGGNKPLAFSGRLEQQAPRRLQETSRFVQAVTAPGGLRRRAPGFAITVKVRLMHARVRKLLVESGRWNDSAWGLPINQHDMAATQLLFALAPIESLRALGFSLSPEETHLYLQLWKYISYVIGVHPELLFGSEFESTRYKEIVAATEGPPDEDARKLTRTFLASPLAGARTDEERKRATRMTPVIEGLMRSIIGDPLSDGLGLERTRHRHLIHPIRAIVRGLEESGGNRPLRARAIASGISYWKMASERGNDPPLFAMPSDLLGIAR